MSEFPVRRAGLKTIVFDLDGTLYQDDRMGEEVNLCACRYIAELKGTSIEEADRLLLEARANLSGIGKTLSRSVMALGGDLKELHHRMGREVNPEGILTCDKRVRDLLRRLALRYELHLYTNNNRHLSGRIMEEIGVSGCFEKIFTVEDYWIPKPDEGVLQKILDAIGRAPGQTLFVGDRYAVDLALPEELGCQVYEARTVNQLLELEELVSN